MFREKVVDVLTEKLRHVVQAMNRQQYLPHTPPQAELDLVFDTSYPDVQPYLFKVSTGYTQPHCFRLMQSKILAYMFPLNMFSIL